MQLDFVTNESQLIFKKKYGKIIDETGEPTIFQTSPDTTIDEQNVTPCEVAENVLIATAVTTGTGARDKIGT